MSESEEQTNVKIFTPETNSMSQEDDQTVPSSTVTFSNENRRFVTAVEEGQSSTNQLDESVQGAEGLTEDESAGEILQYFSDVNLQDESTCNLHTKIVLKTVQAEKKYRLWNIQPSTDASSTSNFDSTEDNEIVDSHSSSNEGSGENIQVSPNSAWEPQNPFVSSQRNTPPTTTNAINSVIPVTFPSCLASSYRTNSSSAISGSRYNSIRSRIPITDEMLVKRCPHGFISFLSDCLNGEGDNSWRKLLSLYNYNYDDIQKFSNRRHQRGLFCSILEEEQFQQYTVRFLKEDLENMPRIDILESVKEWIMQYNRGE